MNVENGECLCNICQQYYDGDFYQCYMRSIEPDERDDKFIFYDFECQQDNELNQHIPNYVVSHSTCDECEKNEVTSNSKCYKCGSRCDMCNRYNSELKEYEKMPCNDCGFRQVIFSGADTKEDFCKWLFTKSHKGYTVVAHNARGYDSYFLYDHLMLTGNRPDPVIFSGSKIMYMHVQSLNLRLLDSLNFLPMPLAKLPKSFWLEREKGSKFLEETWLVLTKEEADKNPSCSHDITCECIWFVARKLNGFSELEVLMKAEWVGIEKFNVVKRKFLNSPIGIIPQGGYSGDRHSKSSIEWLMFLEKKKNDEGKKIKIQHARSEEGEKVIVYTKNVKRPVRYKLDGYFQYCNKKFACEYHGCNWQGCPRCFESDREVTMVANLLHKGIEKQG